MSNWLVGILYLLLFLFGFRYENIIYPVIPVYQISSLVLESIDVSSNNIFKQS
jgi:hypothetical protein